MSKNELIDMRRSNEERKAIETKRPGKKAKHVPYGLRVSLDHESLKKLGITSLPKVGSKINLRARAHVASTSQSESNDEYSPEGKRRNVELELHHLMLDHQQEGGALQAVDDALGNLKNEKSTPAPKKPPTAR